MFLNYRQTFFTLLAVIVCAIDAGRMAVITVPVVDMNNSYPAPVNPGASPQKNGCPRAHQALYNEQVDVLQAIDGQAQIACPYVIYGIDHTTGAPLNTFWMSKEHLCFIDDLPSEVQQTLPPTEYAQESTVVLTLPYEDFSVGTRFKHLPDSDTETHFCVLRADFNTQQVVKDYIHRSRAYAEEERDLEQKREHFVSLIERLIGYAALKGGVVPYIWGGSSFITPYSSQGFFQEDGVWKRKDHQEDRPYSGYDCSELVMRMARIAGIYFPWKTTGIIEHALQPYSPKDAPQRGDLIWTKGHVMIIGDTEQNYLLDAYSYSSGFGQVRKVELSQCFKEVTTYKELHERYVNKQPVTYLKRDGSRAGDPKEFKLLKLIHPDLLPTE